LRDIVISIRIPINCCLIYW